MSSGGNYGDDDAVTAVAYGASLKRQCMYSVLQTYSDLLRPALYPADAKFVLLSTMCRMIDRSREVATATNAGENENGRELGELDELGSRSTVAWRLEELARDFEALDAGVAANASLSAQQRRTLLDAFVVGNNYL